MNNKTNNSGGKSSPLFISSVYKDNLKRIRMPGIVMLALCLIIILVPLIISDNYYTETLSGLLSGVLGMYSYIGVMVLVFSGFSFLFRRNSSDFFHALPLSRRSLYINVLLSVLTWVLITIIVSAVTGCFTAMLFGIVIDIPAILTIVISNLLTAMLVSGCAVLGVSITGTAFSSLAVAGIIMFLPRVVLSICAATMERCSPMLIINWQGILVGGGLSIPFNVLAGELAYNDTSFWVAVLYSLTLSLVYIAAGGLVFCKRASETAEHPAPKKLVQHICRLLLALPILMLAFMMIVSGTSDSDSVISLFVVAVVVYAMYELITTKRFKNLKMAFAVFPIAIVAAFVLCFGAKVYGNSLMGRLPAASEIESMQEISSGNSYEASELAKVWLNDESIKALTADCMKSSYSNIDNRYDLYKYSQISLNIRLKNGNIMSRKLYLTYAQHEELYNAIHSNSKYEDALIKWPADNEITDIQLYASGYYTQYELEEAKKEIWRELTSEYESMSREEKLAFKTNAIFAEVAVEYINPSAKLMPMASYQLPLSVEIMIAGGGWSRYQIGLNTPNTALAAMNMINEINFQNMNRVAELYNAADIDYSNYTITIFDNRDKEAFGGQLSLGYQKDYGEGGAIPEYAISEADNNKLFELLYSNNKKPIVLDGIIVVFEVYAAGVDVYERAQTCFANISAEELEWILSLNAPPVEYKY